MCKAPGCPINHTHHHCRVCDNGDSNHRAIHCPKGTTVYHGTKRQFADLISANGFKVSANGRIGSGVYFTVDFNHAREIAKHRYNNQNPVVIECRVQVNFGNSYNREDSEEELLKKMEEWHKFCKQKANYGIHPQWAGINEKFKEVCAKNPKTIAIRSIHNV